MGSIPRPLATGRRLGSRITTAGSPSITAPKKMKMAAVRKRKTRLLPGTTVMSRIIAAGICCTVRNQEMTPAVPSSSPTAPVIIAACMTRPGSADHLISR